MMLTVILLDFAFICVIHTEWTHIYHTDVEYLKALPDNLGDYCKPKQFESGTKRNWFICPSTKLFIPPQCMCDNTSSCPYSSKDLYRKYSCKWCTDQLHCPCQNSGKCKECSPLYYEAPHKPCQCKLGTSGTYCTKITVRLCTVCKEIIGLENCRNSNNPECFLQLKNNKTSICNWTESLSDFPDCGDSIYSMQGSPESDVECHIYFGVTLSIIGVVIIVMLIVMIIRKRNRIKYCFRNTTFKDLNGPSESFEEAWDLQQI